jgi:hypothetical protein
MVPEFLPKPPLYCEPENVGAVHLFGRFGWDVDAEETE